MTGAETFQKQRLIFEASPRVVPHHFQSTLGASPASSNPRGFRHLRQESCQSPVTQSHKPSVWGGSRAHSSHSVHPGELAIPALPCSLLHFALLLSRLSCFVTKLGELPVCSCLAPGAHGQEEPESWELGLLCNMKQQPEQTHFCHPMSRAGAWLFHSNIWSIN